MNADLELCLKHLQALVSFDTSNPPKKIQSSGLLDYLNSLSYLNPQVTDLGDGSFNILLIKGDPKYIFNVHLDTVPPGDCLLYTSPSPRDVEESRMPSSA